MSMELSRMFGMDIYSTDAEYVGKAYDFIIDLEQGRVSKITLEPLKVVRSKKEARDILKKKSVPYEYVVAVKDIILIDKKRKVREEPREARRTPYSRLLRR